MFWNGRTAIDGFSGSGNCWAAGSRAGDCGFPAIKSRDHIGAHRPGDILEFLLAEIDEFGLDLVANLAPGVLREADPARRADTLEPGGGVDRVAHQVAVALLDHVPDMDADPDFDPLFVAETRVALDHPLLHFDRAADSVDRAPKLGKKAVSGALEDAALADVDRRDRSGRRAAP